MSSFHRQPLLPHFTPDNKQFKRNNQSSPNLDRLLSRAPPQGNFNVNYDTYTLRIPNYTFATPSLLPGSGGLMAVALGKRTTDDSPVLAKLSPYAIRLEREFYITRRICQQDGQKYIPKVIELVSLPNDGLTALIYADMRSDDLVLLEKQNSFRFRPFLDLSLADDNDLEEQQSGEPCDLYSFLNFAIECCSCVHFLHSNTIIHGELRPSAFQWRPKEGTVKIWNFGAGLKSYEEILLKGSGWRQAIAISATAAQHDEQQEAWHQNSHGNSPYARLYSSKGFQSSLAYVSPEQAGRTSNVLDHRTDLYSLGILFYAALTGQMPFEGSAIDIIHAALSRNVPLVHTVREDVPAALGLIIDKLTRKSVDERYSSAYGLREDLIECQRRLKGATGPSKSLAFFPLGLNDINSVFQFPSAIFGRDEEIELIRTVTRRVSCAHEQEYGKGQLRLTTNASSAGSGEASQLIRMESPSLDKACCEVIVVMGPGGIGKSTLASVIHSQARQHGYLATAKFDSNQKRPYNGLLRCLSSILRQLLTESESVIHNFYSDLKKRLGPQFSNVRLMVDMVPELKPILGDHDEEVIEPDSDKLMTHLVNTESRFHAVFLSVVRTIAHKKMITLCLDDIQEADEPSLHLITNLITSRITMLIVLTSRDGGEMPETVSSVIEDPEEMTDAQATFINLAPLGINAISQLVSETLHQTTYDVQPLVDIIFHRTRGNPFYAKQFMLMMNRKEDIWLDWAEKRWRFRLDNVNQLLYPLKPPESANTFFGGSHELDILDVRHLVSHLQDIDPQAQAFLKWASLIGSTFDFGQIKWLMITVGMLDSDGCDGGGICGSSSNIDNSRDPMQESYLGIVVMMDQESNGEGQMPLPEEKKRASQAMAGLQVALQEGIIQPRMGSEFQFVHDRYCQAASMLVKDGARATMNLKIGEMLMLDGGADIFLTADHFVKSLSLVKSLQHRSKYRATLIKAGDAASSSGALNIAWQYYECAISILAENPWEDGEDAKYQETLDLYLKMSELNWWKNHRPEAKQQLSQVMLRTASRPVERARAWQIQARMYFQQQQHEKGIDTIIEALEALGIEGMSHSLIILDTELLRLYEELKTKIKQKGVDTLANNVGPCVDRRILAIMSLFYEASTGAYWTSPRLVEYIALKLVQLSLEYGYGPASGGGFIWLGCTSVSRFSEYHFGAQLGELGLKINEKHAGNSEIARAIIMHHMVLARWTGCHCRDYVYQYQRAYRYAIAGGDKIFSAMALFHVSCSLFWTGSNLSGILWHLNHNMEECEEDDAKDVMTLNISLWRCILAFQGKTMNDTSQALDSLPDDDEEDRFEEAKFIQDVRNNSANPDSQLNWHWSFKLVVLVHFGYYLEAANLGFDIVKTSINHPGHWHIGIANFYHSLAMITCLRNEQNLEESVRQKFFQQVQIHYRKLREWADHSKVNYGLYYKLVEAEISTLENNLERTTRLYNAAIEEALQGDWISCLGLTYERAAEFYIRSNISMLAVPMLHRSIEYYNQWGAWGKSDYVAKRHSALLEKDRSTRNAAVDVGIQIEEDFTLRTEQPTIKEGANALWDDESPEPSLQDLYGDDQMNVLATPESALFSLDIVDLTSIIKSSQVISNEVNSFDELLKKMMGIIMTNSGAETGAIILKEDGLGVTAHSTRSGGYETFDPPMQLSDENVPISALVVHYVLHTHTMLFIPNIQEDTRFATGSWFTRVGAKSVMCLPILHKNSLVGVLYLQANINAFTLKHITVLSLLCDQIGISLTNAFLFKSVRRATATNAEMIETQKEALEEARTSREQALKATKLKSNFLANMSHELRTPFSGFYGMISLLSETRLDPEQREFVLIAKQSCEMLLHIIDDLLDFSKLEARKVKLHSGLLYIEDLIADRMELLITLASKKNLEITYFIDPDVPTMVYGDGNRIGQILMNLIGNAIKFTHHGEVVVRCALEKDSSLIETPLIEDEVVLKFSVQDTGIGMTPEEIKCLFLPFSQVDGSTTRNFGGTGLGLSICLELVRLMGGTIWVDSVEGVGSTFYFLIRIMKACSMDEPGVDADPRESQVTQLKEHIGSPRVLLATSCRQTALFKSLAPSFDYAFVDTAENGPEFAEEQVRSGGRPFDYIVVNSPTPQTMRQLVESIDSNPVLSQLRIILLCAPTVDNIRRHISSNANEPSMQHYIFHPRVVRISKPLRRLKLLSALEKTGHSEMPTISLSSVRQQMELVTKAMAVAERPPQDQQSVPDTIESSFSATCLNETRGIFTPEELAIFQSKRILVAEDNAVARKLIEKQLTRLGFVVETCNNGNECVENWAAHPPDYFMLAWIDHHMPECDGLEATRKIRQLEKDKNLLQPMPIIALTADIQKVTQKNCMEAGMNDYVTKPLMQKDLENILRRYCLKSEISNTI